MTHLDLRFDKLCVDIPIGDSRRDADKRLASCRRICVCLFLRLRLNAYTLHHQRVKVEQGGLHDRFIRLEDENHRYRALCEHFGGVEGAGKWPWRGMALGRRRLAIGGSWNSGRGWHLARYQNCCHVKRQAYLGSTILSR